MEKVVVELEASTKKAEASLQDVVDAIKEINKETTEANENTEKSLKGVEEASKKTSLGVKGIGTALKAAGIGLAIAAFAKLSEIFNKNQKVADAFGTAFEFISIALNDFVTFVIDNTGGVVKFFDAIFKDPMKSLKEFGEGFKKNIQERFESSLEVLGFLASAIKKVFSGDFKGAMEDVKNAGKESLDVITGVNDTFDKSAEAIDKVVGAAKEYAKETLKAAKSNVELEKSSRLAEAANQGLLEKYDRQAEQLRQIRDDDSKSFEERIKANEDLGTLLDKQEKAMLANAKIRIAQAAAELSKNKDNVDLQVAYQEALNEQAAIEAQITGFRSEQLTNTNSLLKEQKDLQNELSLIGKSERELERIEALQDYEAKKELIEREITDEKEKKRILLAADAEYKAKLKEIKKEEDEEKAEKEEEEKEKEAKRIQKLIETRQKERELEKQKIRDKAEVVDAISQFADAETGIGKALLIAKQALALKETIMDLKRITFKGVEAVGAAGVATAQNVAESSKIGFPQNIVTIAGAIAQGVGIISSVKNAVSKTKANAGGAAASVPNIATPSLPSIPPSFNVVGSSETSQLSQSIASKENEPVKAYVVSNDVTTAQSLDRNIIDGATL